MLFGSPFVVLKEGCPWVEIGIAWDTEAREEEWAAFVFHTLGETEVE